MGLAWAAPPVRPLYATCQVTTTSDSGAGSLRECIQNAGNGDTINFNTGVFPLGSPATIALSSALPNIITNSLTIDGSSAGVILDGSGTPGGTNCLTIDGADGVTIKGLQILYCPNNGIQIQNGATNNTIGGTNTTPGGACSGDCNLISGNGGVAGVFIIDSTSISVSGNYIGTDINGTIAISNATGVAITGIAIGNLIGGSTPGERNLISGNDLGLSIGGSSSTVGNTVSGNYIGTDATGTLDLGNTGAGVSLGNTQDNTIGGNNATPGGNCTGECNLISGNDWVGVDIASFGIDTTDNTISGNYIGTDVTGTNPVPNLSGIDLSMGAKLNLIGGNTANKRNLISGNTYDQVRIQNSGTMSNTVSGNYIGTDINGTVAISNATGVGIDDAATGNLIGGDTPGERNLISGNAHNGVLVAGSNSLNNTITRNSIHSNAQLGIDLFDGGNTELPAPILSSVDVNAGNVSGRACAFCTIEIFSDDEDEGRVYEGTTTADASSHWFFSKGSALTGPRITATATDATGNTSEFGDRFLVFLPIVLKG